LRLPNILEVSCTAQKKEQPLLFRCLCLQVEQQFCAIYHVMAALRIDIIFERVLLIYFHPGTQLSCSKLRPEVESHNATVYFGLGCPWLWYMFSSFNKCFNQVL